MHSNRFDPIFPTLEKSERTLPGGRTGSRKNRSDRRSRSGHNCQWICHRSVTT